MKSSNEGLTPSRPESGKEAPPIVEEIYQRLGEFGIHGYARLPRKKKKAAKKLVEGRGLTQRELALLDALRRREQKS